MEISLRGKSNKPCIQLLKINLYSSGQKILTCKSSKVCIQPNQFYTWWRRNFVAVVNPGLVYLATIATLWRPPHIKAKPFPPLSGEWIFQKMKFWCTDATVMSASCPPIALQWRHCCVFASVQRAPSKCRLVWSSCWCACMHLRRVPSKCRWIWTDHEYDHHAGVHVCIHAENQALQVQMNMMTLIVMLVCKCVSVQVCKCASVLVC